MIKFLDSYYDKDCGMSYVKIETECGFFEGYAWLNPEDKEYESEILGGEVAEMRAISDYYKRKVHFLKAYLFTLYNLAKDIRNNPQFDSEHFEYQILQKRIKQNEEQKEIYKEYIRDIKEAIEYKLEARVQLVDKLKKKKQNNK
jgi:hypothetical protein